MRGVTFTFLVAFFLQAQAEQSVNFNDLLKSVVGEAVGNCQFTSCENWPKCPPSWSERYKTKEGCSGVKEKKYCCSADLIPRTCYFTNCGRNSACPGGSHREFFREKEGCRGFEERAYCCRNDVYIPCVDIPCHNSFFNKRTCPEGYEERGRTRIGCSGSASNDRFSCCATGREGERHPGHDPSAFEQEKIPDKSEQSTFSETHTTQLEGGGIRTVTYSNSSRSSCSGWFCGGAEENVKPSFGRKLLAVGLTFCAVLIP